MPAVSAPRALRRAVLALSLLSVALAIALGWALARGPGAGLDALQDGEARRRAVALSVQEGAGVRDSFSDADVGRVLQPNPERRPMGRIHLSTNRHGVRKREYEFEQPPGTVRVVLQLKSVALRTP